MYYVCCKNYLTLFFINSFKLKNYLQKIKI